MTKQDKKLEKQKYKAELKEIKEKIKKEHTSFFSDFKKFITKGNVLDMAVGVVIATAFNAIVNGLVKYVITPCITYLTSGKSIDEWELVLREADEAAEIAKVSIQYGLWLQTIVDFLIIAFSIFVAVRVIRSFERRLQYKEIAKKEAEAAAKKAEEEAAAAKAKAEADAKAAAALAEKEDYLKNIREQSELLREIAASLKK